MWVEVRAHQHASHTAIIQEIADKINKGEISTKAEAQQCLAELLAAYDE